MSQQSLPGYGQPFGSRYINVINHAGPANYQQGNNSDVVTAKSCGMSSFDHVNPSASIDANNQSPTYTVRVQYGLSQGAQNATGANNVNLQWLYAANGNEVANATNLSLEYTRLLIFGAL